MPIGVGSPARAKPAFPLPKAMVSETFPVSHS